MAAVNFLAVPVLVALLAWPLPDEPGLRLGVLLVLLAPCVDWYVPFTRAAGGDAARALTSTPLLLAGQLVAIPVWIAVILGPAGAEAVAAEPLVIAFATLIALPLLLASATRAWAARRRAGAAVVGAAAWVPVPGLALVLALVGASQADAVRGAGAEVAAAAVAFVGLIGLACRLVAYLVAAPLLGALAAPAARLQPPAARAVALSATARNSFVVLPLALGLPEGAALAAATVATQTVVELAGLTALVRLVPRALVPG